MCSQLTVKTLKKAKSKIKNHWKLHQKKEKIPIKKTENRISAEEIRSKIPLPSFDKSAFDGYALKAQDTYGAEENNPKKLKMKDKIHPGKKPDFKIKRGECAKISTGAVMPPGADSVQMKEYTSKINEKKIEVRKPVSPKENIKEKGSEIKKREKIVPKLKKITPQLKGAISACGIKKVKVIKKPKIKVISTGDELKKPGERLEKGEIYDVNGIAISAAIKNCGGNPKGPEIIRDEEKSLRKKIQNSVKKYDLIITTGSTSAGEKDILPKIIDDLGDPGVIIHGLAQKPGKPALVGLIKNTPIFGLPGYPVSALLVFHQLVSPFIRELAGIKHSKETKTKAILKEKILSAKGRKELALVKLKKNKKKIAIPIRKGSGAITSLVKSDGYVEIKKSREILEKDKEITINLFEGTELG